MALSTAQIKEKDLPDLIDTYAIENKVFGTLLKLCLKLEVATHLIAVATKDKSKRIEKLVAVTVLPDAGLITMNIIILQNILSDVDIEDRNPKTVKPVLNIAKNKCRFGNHPGTDLLTETIRCFWLHRFYIRTKA